MIKPTDPTPAEVPGESAPGLWRTTPHRRPAREGGRRTVAGRWPAAGDQRQSRHDLIVMFQFDGHALSGNLLDQFLEVPASDTEIRFIASTPIDRDYRSATKSLQISREHAHRQAPCLDPVGSVSVSQHADGGCRHHCIHHFSAGPDNRLHASFERTRRTGVDPTGAEADNCRSNRGKWMAVVESRVEASHTSAGLYAPRSVFHGDRSRRTHQGVA